MNKSVSKSKKPLFGTSIPGTSSMDFFDFQRRRYFKGYNKSQLLIILKELLQKKKFELATRVALIIFKDSDTSIEMLWKIGMEILRNKKNSNSYCQRFFNQLLSLNSSHNEEILLEYIFYCIKTEQYEEGINKLSEFIFLSPYKENSILVGYTGILYFILWEKSLPDNLVNKFQMFDSSNMDNDDKDEFVNQEYYKTKNFRKNAKKNFEQSLKLNPYNDFILQYYIKILVFEKNFEEAYVNLKNFCDINPNNIISLRLFLKFIKAYSPGDTKWIEVTENIIKIDNFCDRETIFLPLINHYFKLYYKAALKEGLKSYPSKTSSLHYIKLIEKLLVERLDFEIGNTQLWKKLSKALYIINEKYLDVDNNIWKSRRDWWKSFHFENKEIKFESTEDSEFFVYRAICSVYIYGKNVDLKSNYVYNISEKLETIIKDHGFTEKEIYPECSNKELKQYKNSYKNEIINGNIKDKSNKENYNNILEVKTILGRKVVPCLRNYIIRRKTSMTEIVDEKIKAYLERISYEVDCLNKVYSPNLLKNPEYQKDIYEFRDLVLSRLPKLKSFYKNYRNINVFQILINYGVSIFHLEFLDFEYKHPDEAKYFEILKDKLLKLDENQFKKLNPAVIFVKQNNNSGFITEDPLIENKNKNQENKLFIINKIKSKNKKLNSIDEEIVDNYIDLNSNLSKNDQEIDDINDLISQCHDICIKHSIPNYIIKYIFGIQYLTF
ncbi:hypothetical protein BCR36DRAFT_322454 [Piromyces finnis]|uniref:Uncharacterized protein n=1 Tax=Piromyces finnis TaxID=1754191 RepID=A0A1Y1VED5_9FUNG|nr:hypothetical protein BCR36DRAFT_322454 [Piromyces finnis]|eukprot:ORX54177.1 hypothetical protein BCR36DRAFT_322454 [Piromyces finnis]